MLGSHPHEFESRILRSSEQQSTWPAAASFTWLALLGTPIVLVRYNFLTWATLVGALIYAGLFPWLPALR